MLTFYQFGALKAPNILTAKFFFILSLGVKRCMKYLSSFMLLAKIMMLTAVFRLIC